MAALALLGCSSNRSSGSGCAKDSDCKGDRLCIAGECSDGPTKVPPTPQQGGQAQQPAAQPNPPAAAPEPQPGAYANDGLPEIIPAPGSAVPTLAEWNAVPREITARGSSKLGCETKMLREWLRVSCHKNSRGGEPVDVEHVDQSGQQAFKFVGTGVASVVVQVVRGRNYKAMYTWDYQGTRNQAELTVQWPSDVQRPVVFFTEQ